METVRQAWLMLKAQFLGNHKSRVLQLNTRFLIFKQGNLSINDCCRRIKGVTEPPQK
jgi:hypothetical protein